MTEVNTAKQQQQKLSQDEFYGLYLQSLMVYYCLSCGLNEVSRH